MSHEPIIIESLSAHYEVPVVKKKCSIRVMLLIAAAVGFAVGAVLF